MLKYFKCPDGEKILKEECMKKCRMRVECCSYPYRAQIIQRERTWTGTVSVTQGLSGSRESVLKITKGYTCDPLDRTYATIGTGSHENLEKHDGVKAISGVWLKFDDLFHGTFDYYDDASRKLLDNKVTGCYKIQKALGLIKQQDGTFFD